MDEKIEEVGETESTWTPFVQTSKKLLEEKSKLSEFLKTANFNNPSHREFIIRSFFTLFNSELQVFITEKEYREISALLSQLNFAHLNNLPTFKDLSFKLLGKISVVMQNAGLGLLTKRKKDPVTRLFETAELEPKLTNSYGVEIHPLLLVLAHALAQRTLKKYDNILIVEGEPGSGKTTFSFALATTLSDVYKTYGIDSPFTSKNIFTAEDRVTVLQTIQDAPQYSIFDLTESANQFSSRDFMDFAQKGLINLIERIRFHGLTIILEWASIRQLDINIRENRPLYYISVMRRKDSGKAVVRATNKNPYSASYLHAFNQDKAKLPLTTFAERMQLLETDPLCVLTLPFYPLPTDIDDKLQAMKNIKFNPYLSKIQRTKNDVLVKCFSYIAKLMNEGKKEFSPEDLNKFREQEAVEIYWEDLVRAIKKATLIRKQEYFDPAIQLEYPPIKGFIMRYA